MRIKFTSYIYTSLVRSSTLSAARSALYCTLNEHVLLWPTLHLRPRSGTEVSSTSSYVSDEHMFSVQSICSFCFMPLAPVWYLHHVEHATGRTKYGFEYDFGKYDLHPIFCGTPPTGFRILGSDSARVHAYISCIRQLRILTYATRTNGEN